MNTSYATTELKSKTSLVLAAEDPPATSDDITLTE